MLVEPMLARLRAQPDLPSALNHAVSEVISLHGAEFGDIQLVGSDGHLWLVGHCGLPLSFIRAAARIAPDAGTACARAWRQRELVAIADVSQDKEFVALMGLAALAKFRSVVSAPLVSTGGEAIGVISAHFATTHTPSRIEAASLQSFCRQGADHLLSRASAPQLAEQAERLHRALLKESPGSASPRTGSAASPRGATVRNPS